MIFWDSRDAWKGRKKEVMLYLKKLGYSRNNKPFDVGDGYLNVRRYRINKENRLEHWNHQGQKWEHYYMGDVDYLYRALILERGHLFKQRRRTK